MTVDKTPESTEAPIAPKISALQIWNGLLRKTLEDHLIVRVTKNRMIPIVKHLEKAEAAIQAAETFEVTKNRMIVDALIERIKLADERKAEFKSAYDRTWRIQFKKRRNLLREYIIYSTSREVYQQALLVVVNTTPPVQQKQPTEREVSMNGKDTGHLIVSGK